MEPLTNVKHNFSDSKNQVSENNEKSSQCHNTPLLTGGGSDKDKENARGSFPELSPDDVCKSGFVGGGITEFSVDFLTLLGPEVHKDKILSLVREYYSLLDKDVANFQELGAWKGYTQGFYIPTRGVMFYEGNSHDKSFWLLSLSGSACKWLGYHRLLEFSRKVRELNGVHCSRFDGAIDLKGGVDDLLEVAIASCNHGYNCHFQTYDVQSSGGKSGCKGLTLYMGSSGSEQRVCLYDKGLERKTQYKGKWLRWETRFRKKTASYMFSYWCTVTDLSTEQFVGEKIIGECLSTVDFRIKGCGKTRHLSRFQRLAWFSELIERCEPEKVQRLSGSSDTRSAESFVRFLYEQVSPALNRVRGYLGASDMTNGDIFDLLVSSSNDLLDYSVSSREVDLAVMVRDKISTMKNPF